MCWFSRIFKINKDQEGIFLREDNPWEATYSEDNMAVFLRAITELVPEGSILYLEGGFPSKQLRSFLEDRRPEKVAKVAKGTLWPRPEIFHMVMSRDNMEGLIKFAESMAYPEIGVHLHVYKDGKVLLQWYDAFSDDPILISKEIPEDRYNEFRARLNIEDAQFEQEVASELYFYSLTESLGMLIIGSLVLTFSIILFRGINKYSLSKVKPAVILIMAWGLFMVIAGLLSIKNRKLEPMRLTDNFLVFYKRGKQIKVNRKEIAKIFYNRTLSGKRLTILTKDNREIDIPYLYGLKNLAKKLNKDLNLP